MRIKTKVVTQSGRVMRPAGAVFDVDDETAGRMLVAGTAEPAEDTVLPVASSPIGGPSAPAGSGTPADETSGTSSAPGAGDGPESEQELVDDETSETAEETESETTTEEDEEVQVFAEFNAADAIAYVETVETVERLVRLAGVEQQRDTPRVTVTRAIEKRIEEIRTQSSTPSSQE
jgi:hypothetical protein